MIPLIIIYMVVVKSIDNSILGECKGKRVKVLNIILIGVFWVLMIFLHLQAEAYTICSL